MILAAVSVGVGFDDDIKTWGIKTVKNIHIENPFSEEPKGVYIDGTSQMSPFSGRQIMQAAVYQNHNSQSLCIAVLNDRNTLDWSCWTEPWFVAGSTKWVAYGQMTYDTSSQVCVVTAGRTIPTCTPKAKSER